MEILAMKQLEEELQVAEDPETGELEAARPRQRLDTRWRTWCIKVCEIVCSTWRSVAILTALVLLLIIQVLNKLDSDLAMVIVNKVVQKLAPFATVFLDPPFNESEPEPSVEDAGCLLRGG